LRRNEWEIVDLRGSVRLIVAPAVFIGIKPLRWVVWEIIDEVRSFALIVTPAVIISVAPLGIFEWERV
jgi:hypothetical protein